MTSARFIKDYAPALAWGIFIFVLSVMPGKDFPQVPKLSDLLSVDKLVHMLFYTTLTGLILRGYRTKLIALPRPKAALWVLSVAAFAMAFGWVLEFIQEKYCEDRYFEIMDGVANSIGALAYAVYSLKTTVWRSGSAV